MKALVTFARCFWFLFDFAVGLIACLYIAASSHPILNFKEVSATIHRNQMVSMVPLEAVQYFQLDVTMDFGSKKCSSNSS